ncbi:MAG: sodium:solute symporter family transporter [Phycisphaerae bacterium]
MSRFTPILVLVIALSVVPAGGIAAAASEPNTPIASATLEGGVVDFTDLPSLPVALRGAFIGKVDGVLIVAGGVIGGDANRPLSRQTFSRKIYVLPPNIEDKPLRWRQVPIKLPRGVAFGAAAVGPGELICIGGVTPDGATSDVIRLAWVGQTPTEPGWFYVDPLTGQWHPVSDGQYEVDGEIRPLPDDARPVDRAKQKTIPAHLEIRRGVRKEDGRYVGLPDLPRPLAMGQAAVIGSTLYLIGGQTALSSPDANATPTDPMGKGMLTIALPERPTPTPGPLGWLEDMVRDARRAESVPPVWSPGDLTGPDAPGDLHLLMPALGVRRDEIAERKALWIMGGWRRGEDGTLTPVREIRRFLPSPGARAGWKRISDIPAGLVPVSSTPIGHAHLLVLAGQEAPPAGSVARFALTDVPAGLLAYHTYTDTWVRLGEANRFTGGRITAIDGDAFVWLGADDVVAGDVDANAPAPRTAVRQGELTYDTRYFGWLDFGVIALYIAGMMGVGWYFARREKNTDDYFLGGRKIPWWAAGLSMYATGISAISFMAIPAKTFHTDWAYIAQGVFPPIAMVIVAYAFIPLLRRLRITTVMEYYEMRFGRSIRVLGSLQVILSQLLARMSVVVLLPSIALSAVTGWPVWGCIVVMGVLATIYTVLGGISAVIWTDVVQVVVIFGGAILSIAILCMNVPGGLVGVVEIGSRFEKFTSAYWDFDLTIASIWVFSIWAINDMFLRLGQENLQRAFATKDAVSARRAMITMAVVSVPGTLIFYFLGSALFAYYHQHPAQIDPTLGHDSIFPLFIAQKLPAGVAGLVIAGLFAAAMSTLDSGMNVVATIITRDFFAFFGRGVGERRRLRAAKWITSVTGIVATAMALYLSSFQRGSLWDTFIEITAVVGGGFSGVIVLAMLTRRIGSAAMFTGLICGYLFAIALKVQAIPYPFKPFVYGTFSLVVTCAVAFLVSLALPNRKDLTGLTVWTADGTGKEND